jgi:glyceraldehyde 3-phosphate dehydrogenase|tara:strand:+ start:107 stop:1099 length:993 start_codon:yes stop_codon:yes gene_type:complete
MRIAINGFGRIGRSILRIALEKKLNIVAINDVHGLKDAEYLLKYDSVYGKYPGKISVKKNDLIIGGKKICVLQERDPLKLPWKKLKVDIVIESTGAFRYRKDLLKHIESGAKKVIVTAPTKDKSDITVVPGVNDKKIKKSHKMISVASCTTNCVAPVAKVLNDGFGIKWALISTIHGYTSSQSLVDSANEKDPRRGRAAAVNLIPTTTGASKAVIEVLPELKGKLDGSAIRAPIIDGSIIDFVVELKKPFNEKKINTALKNASKKEMKGIIEYSEDELVSSDIIGNPYSAIIDSKMTKVEGNLLKVLAWYDNEYGYSSRVVDVIKILGRK